MLPSAANFVFARHPAHDGAALAAALRERAVLVRHFATPRIADYLRITVGTDAQIDRLLPALSDILGSEPADGKIGLAYTAFYPGLKPQNRAFVDTRNVII